MLKSVLRQNGYEHDSWIKLLVNSLIKVSKNGSPLPQFLKRYYVWFYLQEQLTSGKLEMVFRTTQRMPSCFRFKDAIPRSLLSGIIYEYKCPRCISRYIGSTYRYWEKRLEEHLHISSITGKPLKGLQSFAPLHHAKGKCCINSSDDFCIIGKEKDRHLIRFNESIFINHCKPSLNTKEDNTKLVLFTQ